MAETTKQRTERIMGMSRAQLVMHCKELERQRDLAVEALEAMAQDGWLLCGPEGLSDAQKKVCEALSTIKESEAK